MRRAGVWAAVVALMGVIAGCVSAPNEFCQVAAYGKHTAFKAMAYSRSNDQCYWVWNRGSQQQANADSLANCSRQTSGCMLVRSGNAYVGPRPGAAPRASAGDFFQGIAAGALMAGGNPAAGAALMTDLAQRSTPPPRPAPPPRSPNLFGLESLSCSQQEQAIERETARISRESVSWGICQKAVESGRLYGEAAEFHRRCHPDNASARAQAAEYDRARSETDRTAAAACS